MKVGHSSMGNKQSSRMTRNLRAAKEVSEGALKKEGRDIPARPAPPEPSIFSLVLSNSTSSVVFLGFEGTEFKMFDFFFVSANN